VLRFRHVGRKQSPNVAIQILRLAQELVGQLFKLCRILYLNNL
jgi:hypothetical protein